MADCSELSKLINQLAMNLASEKDVKGDLDSVLVRMREYFPEIRRQDIVDAIIEASQGQAKVADEVTKKLAQVRQEARSDKALTKKIDDLSKYLDAGTAPAPKPKAKEVPDAIERLRKTRDNLMKWVKTSDPVMRERMSRKLEELKQKIESGEIGVDEGNSGKLHEELQGIQSQIDEARSKILDERRTGELQDKIDTLSKHLEEGTLPEKKAGRRFEDTEAVASMKSIIEDLRTKLRHSEPAQAERLQKRIDELTELLDSGNIFPKVKEKPTLKSKELEQKEYDKNRLAQQVRRIVNSQKPKKLFDYVADPFNAARAIMTSGELSGILRQGGWLTFGHPLRTASVIPDMVRAMMSEKAQWKIENDIRNSRYAPLWTKAKMYLAPADSSAELTKMEEGVLNHWTGKIPFVRASQRAYVTFLNLLRAKSFETMADIYGVDTLERAEAIANYINVSTGRGSLGSLEQHAVPLGTLFFAPRYVVSRFQLLAGQPFYRAKGARTMIAKEYARSLIGIGLVLALGIAAGGVLETDPRSSDFGKLRFGKTRLDLLMGISQATTFLGRMVTGETKEATTGKITKFYGGRWNTLTTFMRTKLAPMPGTAVDVMQGKNVVRQDVTPKSVALNLTTPMTYGNIYQTLKEEGLPAGISLSLLAFLGAGLNTFTEDQKPVDPEVQQYKADRSAVEAKKRRGEPLTQNEMILIRVGNKLESSVSALQKKADAATTDKDRKAAYDQIKKIIKVADKYREGN